MACLVALKRINQRFYGLVSKSKHTHTHTKQNPAQVFCLEREKKIKMMFGNELKHQ